MTFIGKLARFGTAVSLAALIAAAPASAKNFKIAVGDGAGADREAGLETEIVALANPYTDDLSDGLPVRVLYQGAPRADAQVELFAKSPEGEVEITLLRTDAEGVALLPVTPGQVYLADAVVVRPLEPVAEDDPVWESLWASLTFKVPE